jgi:hypothetical protein
VRNDERYLAFPPAVPQAFLEVSDLLVNFYRFTFSTRICKDVKTLIKDHRARGRDTRW